MIRFVRTLPIALIFCGGLSAMPSYEDVLLVVKAGDPMSQEVAAYFQAARGIPSVNVVTLAISVPAVDRKPSMGQRNTFIDNLAAAITARGLDGKINYIVLSSGFPGKAYDDAGYTRTTLFDLYIMYRLSDQYPSGQWYTNNRYAYIRSENYNHREDLKYTKSKYGHYIVSHLDGPSVSAIKKMIDSFGPAAYESALSPVKYVVDSQGQFQTSGPQLRFDDIKMNVAARGGTFLDWNTNDGIINQVKDIHFLDCDWVNGPVGGPFTRVAPINAYPHSFKHLSFKPGSLMNVYRSFPTGDGWFGPARAGLYDLSGGVLTSRMKADGSDFDLQNIGSLAMDEDAHELWCGLGIPPSHVLRKLDDDIAVPSEFQNGNGLVVYDKSGNALRRFTRENTGGGLLSDAVYTLSFDRFKHRMYVGTFAGVCYYDLVAKIWAAVPGLWNAGGAFVHQIYVDPTTSGGMVYVTFTIGGIGWSINNKIPNFTRIFEHNTATLATVSRQYGIAATFYNAQVVKTEPNFLWMRYQLSTGTPFDARVSKINLSTQTPVYTLDLANVGGVDYRPSASYTRNLHNLLATVSGGVTNIYFPIGNDNAATAIHNGVMRLTDTGGVPLVTVWGSPVWTEQPTTNGEKIFQNPFHPERIYLSVREQARLQTSGGRVIEFSDATPAGVEIKNGSLSLLSVNAAVFDEQNDGRLWLAQYQQYEATQQFASYEFFHFGLSGAMGGFSHDSFYFDGSQFLGTATVNQFISPANPDYFLYSCQTSTGTDLTATHQMRGMAMLLMDGFYFAEARYASLPVYPSLGYSGHHGHMLVMDPKAAPYAPRVDFAKTDFKIRKNGDRRQVSAVITSPTILPAENYFLSSTIHEGTVQMKNAQGAAVPISVSYLKASNQIVASTTAGLDPTQKYFLTLACGVNGIKNSRGASLVNTRSNEFKDEITLTYDFAPENDAALSGKNTIVSLTPAYVFRSGSGLSIQFALKEGAGNVSLELYTQQGSKIKTLKPSEMDLAAQTGKWDGLWENGNAKSGIYFVVLRVDGKQEDMKKVVVLRDAGGL